MRILLCAVFATVAAAVPASANTDGDQLKKLGLLGPWAHDCSKPASGENPHLSIEAPEGALPVERLFTNGAYDRENWLADVVVLPDGRVQWTQITLDGTVKLVKLVETDRNRTWSSIGADGEVFIKDGRFTSGKEVQWFNRCAR